MIRRTSFNILIQNSDFSQMVDKKYCMRDRPNSNSRVANSGNSPIEEQMDG
ncbi:hypothetical protein DPMN_177116 [Dreissena polymorpha]|uniref:Uncharacterized protein n=1 Tax=Dreissena polymorpha TaxID=45954 RepID=A0A9D4E9N5_DREPO|nr:hypothetical protein DPMN_177116 [Dreissena polymorpha]